MSRSLFIYWLAALSAAGQFYSFKTSAAKEKLVLFLADFYILICRRRAVFQ
jgi:hypothetical protein